MSKFISRQENGIDSEHKTHSFVCKNMKIHVKETQFATNFFFLRKKSKKKIECFRQKETKSKEHKHDCDEQEEVFKIYQQTYRKMHLQKFKR